MVLTCVVDTYGELVGKNTSHLDPIGCFHEL